MTFQENDSVNALRASSEHLGFILHASLEDSLEVVRERIHEFEPPNPNPHPHLDLNSDPDLDLNPDSKSNANSNSNSSPIMDRSVKAFMSLSLV